MRRPSEQHPVDERVGVEAREDAGEREHRDVVDARRGDRLELLSTGSELERRRVGS
jgi:hypothetical protein